MKRFAIAVIRCISALTRWLPTSFGLARRISAKVQCAAARPKDSARQVACAAMASRSGDPEEPLAGSRCAGIYERCPRGSGSDAAPVES